MKRRNLFLIIVMMLVVCLSCSLLLVGCKNDKKKDSDEEANDLGVLDSIDFSDYASFEKSIKSVLDSRNYSFSIEGNGSKMVVKCIENAVYLSQPMGSKNIEGIFEKRGDKFILYQNMNGKWTGGVNRETDLDTAISQANNELVYFLNYFSNASFTFDSSKGTLNGTIEDGTKITIGIKDKSSISMHATHGDQSIDINIYDIGKTNIDIPNVEINDKLFAIVQPNNLQSAIEQVREIFNTMTYTMSNNHDGYPADMMYVAATNKSVRQYYTVDGEITVDCIFNTDFDYNNYVYEMENGVWTRSNTSYTADEMRRNMTDECVEALYRMSEGKFSYDSNTNTYRVDYDTVMGDYITDITFTDKEVTMHGVVGGVSEIKIYAIGETKIYLPNKYIDNAGQGGGGGEVKPVPPDVVADIWDGIDITDIGSVIDNMHSYIDRGNFTIVQEQISNGRVSTAEYMKEQLRTVVLNFMRPYSEHVLKYENGTTYEYFKLDEYAKEWTRTKAGQNFQDAQMTMMDDAHMGIETIMKDMARWEYDDVEGAIIVHKMGDEKKTFVINILSNGIVVTGNDMVTTFTIGTAKLVNIDKFVDGKYPDDYNPGGGGEVDPNPDKPVEQLDIFRDVDITNIDAVIAAVNDGIARGNYSSQKLDEHGPYRKYNVTEEELYVFTKDAENRTTEYSTRRIDDVNGEMFIKKVTDNDFIMDTPKVDYMDQESKINNSLINEINNIIKNTPNITFNEETREFKGSNQDYKLTIYTKTNCIMIELRYSNLSDVTSIVVDRFGEVQPFELSKPNDGGNDKPTKPVPLWDGVDIKNLGAVYSVIEQNMSAIGGYRFEKTVGSKGADTNTSSINVLDSQIHITNTTLNSQWSTIAEDVIVLDLSGGNTIRHTKNMRSTRWEEVPDSEPFATYLDNYIKEQQSLVVDFYKTVMGYATFVDYDLGKYDIKGSPIGDGEIVLSKEGIIMTVNDGINETTYVVAGLGEQHSPVIYDYNEILDNHMEKGEPVFAGIAKDDAAAMAAGVNEVLTKHDTFTVDITVDNQLYTIYYSPNQRIVENKLYDPSKHAWYKMMIRPDQYGYGVEKYYIKSDKDEWWVKDDKVDPVPSKRFADIISGDIQYYKDRANEVSQALIKVNAKFDGESIHDDNHNNVMQLLQDKLFSLDSRDANDNYICINMHDFGINKDVVVQ